MKIFGSKNVKSIVQIFLLSSCNKIYAAPNKYVI